MYVYTCIIFYYSYSPLENTHIIFNVHTMCDVGPEVCAAHPESCQIDRVSVMNEDGECPEHQCAEGYGGELCNSKLHCQGLSCN